MSKELQSLKRIRKNLTRYRDSDDSPYLFPQDEIDLDTIETALKKQEGYKKLLNEQAKSNRYLMEQIRQSQKKLKALDIIVKKNICIRDFRKSKTLEEYNGCHEWEENLTQEEYDLLKEVLKDE